MTGLSWTNVSSRSLRQHNDAVLGLDHGNEGWDSSAAAGQYANTIMVEGVAVAVGLAVVCLWLGSRVFLRENA
jgi:hypothetical protein